MRGQYETAIASYDRALGFRPAWKEAEENKALALARKKLMEDSVPAVSHGTLRRITPASAPERSARSP